MTRGAPIVALIALAACGKVPAEPPPSKQPPGQAVMSASGRVTGGRFTMDVQVGQPVQPAPSSGGSTTITPAAR